MVKLPTDSRGFIQISISTHVYARLFAGIQDRGSSVVNGQSARGVDRLKPMILVRRFYRYISFGSRPRG